MIPDETIEQVRDSADIVGLIGESVALKRTGADYRGPCPFHGGTNRNFAVIPKKGRYYCFVCHESGDVFSWLMKRLGMDYPDGGARGGPADRHRHPGAARTAGPDPHEPLYSAVAAAHDWFTRQLLEQPDAHAAREYLEGRDIPLDTAAMLGLGFAPRARSFLTAMANLGIEERVLLEAGLAAQREDGSVSPPLPGPAVVPDSRPAGAGGGIRRAAARVRVSRSTSTRPRPRSSTREDSCTICTWPGSRSAKRSRSFWSRDISTCSGWCWPGLSTSLRRSAPR